MGKVVVLGGNARSGKSTLSYMLVKKGFSRISFDNLFDVIEKSLNVNMDELGDKTKYKLFKNIVDKSIEESENENTNIVIDMFDFLPKDINKLKNKNEIEVYFLAYPSCDEKAIKYNVVHYAKPTDWISQVDEDYLNICVKRFHARNKILVKECEKYNLPLIDTKSGKERNIALKKLLNKITRK